MTPTQAERNALFQRIQDMAAGAIGRMIRMKSMSSSRSQPVSTPKSAVSEVQPSAAWVTQPHDDLPMAIAEFKAALPGWWYSVCECHVSCDASCAPTVESPDIVLAHGGGRNRGSNQFDSGFHADLSQPSTLAEALRDVMAQALAAKALIAQAKAGTTERAARPREDHT